MRFTPPAIQFSDLFRTHDHHGAIEWEELPSLADSLSARLIARGHVAKVAEPRQRPPLSIHHEQDHASAAWDATRPAALDTSPPEQPFREPVKGVAIREVHAPEVFRHFFGA